ncbi:MAG: class I SAM-dependent methyltransferase [Candidatus Eremiobacteraeota bacterium]|nr:class I SAM-dependent methyltransferase [Candidatus Eremiobacteraeota bacterium]
MRLYRDLAAWWPLVSSPADYAEEATFFWEHLASACDAPPRRVLELGAGGGNNALHLKAHCTLTLTDISSEMLDVSRVVNPECEHIVGDMRNLRLGRTFDAIFVHDAIEYMTTENDLRSAIETAAIHCRAGGAAMFVPDYVRETFAPSTDHGGHDSEVPGDDRAARYLEWTYDLDPDDTTYQVDFALLLRDGDGRLQVVHDAHTFGLFRREVWNRLLRDAGFAAYTVVDRWKREVFVAKRR